MVTFRKKAISRRKVNRNKVLDSIQAYREMRLFFFSLKQTMIYNLRDKGTDMKLSEVKIGQTCEVRSVGGEGELRQHFLDMGLVPGIAVTVKKYAPLGDPMEVELHGYELTLRISEAEKIEVTESEKKPRIFEHKVNLREHPGLGEYGKSHDAKTENPLPDSTVLRFALAGNQNCGKTTLFNRLTGSNQHVGNFPGVTVESKSGSIRGVKNAEVIDLPGIYSLSPYSSEEIVSRDYILKQKPHGIINIADATNIERNLYLTMQLMELEIPMVLALNMMDEVHNNGGSIRINEMEEILGIPVIPISAAHNEGIEELVSHAIHVAKYQEKPKRQDFCDEKDHGGAVHRCLHGIMHLISDHAEACGLPLRFAATKVIENDARVTEALQLDRNETEMLEHIILQMENECGMDRKAAIADMRYTFIERLCRETVNKAADTIESVRSASIDRILTGKYTGIPVFFGIMLCIFYLTFNVIGPVLQGFCEDLITKFGDMVTQFMTNIGVADVLQSLVNEGIISGVGAVLSFVPIIVVLFFFLSLLEDSGYMARVAFVMDKLLRRLGLSGRSIVPMLIGFGCTVPGVMASKTLPSERDRKLTILLTPFMSCSAKLPVYGFFCRIFFPDKAGLVVALLYLLGIVTAILFAVAAKHTVFKGEAVPFVMELPNYRLPRMSNVLHLLWDKARDFIEKAFTIILLASIVVWFFRTFDPGLHVAGEENSMLAMFARNLAVIFRPLGFGDWRITTALIAGFLAKESVAATLSVLFSSKETLMSLLSGAAVVSLLVFTLLYTPCVAAIAAVRRELGARWAVLMVLGQCSVAWVISWAAYLLFTAI